MKLRTRRSAKRPPEPLLAHSSFAESLYDDERAPHVPELAAYEAQATVDEAPVAQAIVLTRGRYDSSPMSFRVPEVEPPRGRVGRSRSARVVRRLLALVLLVLVLGVIGGIAFAAMQLTGGSDTNVAAGKKVAVSIPSGADANTIADRLAKAGVVDNKTTFKLRLRMNGDGADFRSGSYTMVTGSSYDRIVKTLNQGPPAAPTFNITMPEGYRLAQMAQKVGELHAKGAAEGSPLPRFNRAQYEQSLKRQRVPAKYQPKDPRKLEGFMFPATYELLNTATADQLVQKQLQAFQNKFDTLDMGYARSKNLTPYEVVIIASMVEREARVDKERALIAGVMYNRLKLGMTLGIDATIQYAVDPEVWKTELTLSDLAIDSPYNTRDNGGLPPTPIANPGFASLQAAAKPAETKFLYYKVVDESTGEHFFTDSYDEFLSK